MFRELEGENLTMKILSIGNSFSQDAQRYLHELAKADGFDLQTVNLCVGGCSLETHYKNMREDLAEYEYESNGVNTYEKVTMRSILESDTWDVITLQQASHFSAKYETYFPYLSELVAYVRECCPNAKVYLQETWPYENGSARLNSVGYQTSAEMFNDIKSCYARAGLEAKVDGIIPSGTAMMEAINRGMKIHRDTFHAGLGAGRYMLALVWYKTLTGRAITNNVFDNFDEEVSSLDRETVIQIASLVTSNSL